MVEISNKSVVLSSYDPRWLKLYEDEASHLQELLGSDLVLRIEHFGSTAIPGMLAKPVIDIMVEVPCFKRAKLEIVSKLEANNYYYIWRYDRPPGHMMFIKYSPSSQTKTHHIHMVPKEHKLWERLLFRDYLRANPEAARRYALLKRDLAARYPDDREAYTNHKGEFVKVIMDKALCDTRRNLDS